MTNKSFENTMMALIEVGKLIKFDETSSDYTDDLCDKLAEVTKILSSMYGDQQLRKSKKLNKKLEEIYGDWG
jgi:hypothetical protein